MDKHLQMRYEALKALVVKRRQPFTEFVMFIEKETSWLEGPASTRFHLCEPSGLLKHSVGVAETLLKFRAALAPEISEESCVIVGLFHDVGKVGMPGKPLYLPNENEWEKKNRGIMYKYNPAVTTMGLAVRSCTSSASTCRYPTPKPRPSATTTASTLPRMKWSRRTKSRLRC
jgi:hypothetical protein